MKIDLAQLKKYGNLELLASQLVEGFITGMHRSPYHGFSVEFAEHKQYNFGESIRHVDWKVYGRTEKLYTKRYEEETNLKAMLMLDVSGSMYYPEPNYDKLSFSIVSCACLAYLLQRQRDAVGLCTFSNQILFKSPLKSTPAHLQTLYQTLYKTLDQSPGMQNTAAAAVLHEVADLMKRRALIVLFSDMFENAEDEEELFRALQHLKHNHHEVLVFHTTDAKTEKEFDFEDRPYELVDKETGDSVKLIPSEIKVAYQRMMKDFHQRIKLKCAQFKITFIEVDVKSGVDQILLPYLVKRRGMR